MRTNRALLYGGMFLVAVGGVLVVADASRIDSATLADGIRLWPVAVIAVGVGLVLRRTRFGLGGGLVAAAMPGLLLGSGLAILPRFPGDCGVREAPAISRTDEGTFDDGGIVSVRGGCGSLEVTTLPGSAWRLDSGNTAGRTPVISADEHELSVSAGRGWNALTAGRDRWSLAVPTVPLEVLALSLNAGDGRATLTGAHIGLLEINANLSDVAIDAWGAELDSLAIALKWSNASLELPAGRDISGSIDLANGELRVCAPPDVGLRVDIRGPQRAVTAAGLEVPDGDWQSPNYDSALNHIDLDVAATFGVVAINPIGGCR